MTNDIMARLLADMPYGDLARTGAILLGHLDGLAPGPSRSRELLAGGWEALADEIRRREAEGTE